MVSHDLKEWFLNPFSHGSLTRASFRNNMMSILMINFNVTPLIVIIKSKKGAYSCFQWIHWQPIIFSLEEILSTL